MPFFKVCLTNGGSQELVAIIAAPKAETAGQRILTRWRGSEVKITTVELISEDEDIYFDVQAVHTRVRVKIKAVSDPHSWYRNRIGDEFDGVCIEQINGVPNLVADLFDIRNSKLMPNHTIWAQDCELVHVEKF